MLLRLEKPVLSPLLQRELKELARDGITPEADEILWLSRLCDDVARPNKSATSMAYALPLVVGGGALLLYRPAWALRIWFNEVAAQWMSGFSPDFRALCRGYLYAQGRDVSVIDRLTTRRAFQRAVIDWARGLKTVTLEELQAGIDIIEGNETDTVVREIEDGNPAPSASPWDYGELNAYLMHYYAVKFDEIRTLPDNVVHSMIDALPLLMQQENPLGGTPSNPPEDRAFWALRQAVRIIRKDHAGKKEASGNG